MSTVAFRTSNPALSDSVFRQVREESEREVQPATMTVQGTVLKTLVLVGILLAAASFVWSQTLTPVREAAAGATRFTVDPSVVMYLILGSIGGLIAGFATIFAPRVAPWSSPVYAACEGLALGGISAFMERTYPGIALEAVGLTVAVLAAMLLVYATGIIKVTPGFAAAVVSATLAVCLVYLVDVVLGLFGIRVPYLHENGTIGIIVSLVIVGIASLNLLLDFELIVSCARQGAPRFMEWYGGFSLLVTLVWLYLEMLRLLAKLRGRD